MIVLSKQIKLLDLLSTFMTLNCVYLKFSLSSIFLIFLTTDYFIWSLTAWSVEYYKRVKNGDDTSKKAPFSQLNDVQQK